MDKEHIIEQKLEAVGELEGHAFAEFMESGNKTSVLLTFPEFSVYGHAFNGIGCHYGIDRTLYYDLYRGGQRIISMNDWRLEEFLCELDLKVLQSTASSMKKAEAIAAPVTEESAVRHKAHKHRPQL